MRQPVHLSDPAQHGASRCALIFLGSSPCPSCSLADASRCHHALSSATAFIYIGIDELGAGGATIQIMPLWQLCLLAQSNRGGAFSGPAAAAQQDRPPHPRRSSASRASLNPVRQRCLNPRPSHQDARMRAAVAGTAAVLRSRVRSLLWQLSDMPEDYDKN